MRKKNCYGTVGLVLLTIGTGSVFAASNIAYTWERINTPLHVNAPGLVVNDGALYVLGGVDDAASNLHFTNRVWRFDPVANNWQQLTGTLPYGMRPMVNTGVVHSGRYITSPQLGTYNNNGWGSHSKVIEYDLGGTSTGVETANYGYTVWQAEFVRAADGRIYSFGGWTGSGVNKIYRYDPVAKTLTQVATLAGPGRTTIKGLLEPSGKIVLFGGNQPLPDCKWVEIFDPATEQITWSGQILPDDLDHYGGLAAWVANVNGADVIYVADPNSRAVYTFDPAAKTFTRASFTLPTTTQAPNMVGNVVLLNGKIYVTETKQVSNPAQPYDTYLWVGTPYPLLGGEVGLRLTQGTFNGVSLTPGTLDGQTIEVNAGETISGTAGIKVLRGINPGSIFPVVWTPTWGGSPETIYQTITENAPVGGSATNPTVTNYTVNINLKAPATGGTYWLVFGTAGEVGSDHVASQSHWEDSTTWWNDTYTPDPNPHADWSTRVDLATLNDSQYTGLINNYYLSAWWRNKLGQYVEQGDHTGASTLAGDAIKVIVLPPPKLVGHWDFQERSTSTTLTDRSGNFNDGTLQNMEAMDWTLIDETGFRPSPIVEKNYALSFDGVDEYVSIPNSDTLNFGTGEFTLNLWFKVTGPLPNTTWVALWSKHNTAMNHDKEYWIGMFGAGRADTGRPFACLGYRSDGYYEMATGPNSVADGNWHMATMVRRLAPTGRVLHLYIDGVLLATTPATLNVDNTNPVTIGCSSYGGGYGFFPGQIDEISLYSGALSPMVIRQMVGKDIRADINGDAHVDASDFDVFSACYNGPVNPPGCQ